MKIKSIFKKCNKKVIICVIASILLIGSLVMAAFWLVIDYGKPISPGSLIEARDINQMTCELVFMCGHDCGYTINQRFGCGGAGFLGHKTIAADNWAYLGSCDRWRCQCSGGDCQTSGPVHAGDPVTAEDLNRIIASIKLRASGWCTLNDPKILGLDFVSPGDTILASKMNEVRGALDHLSAQQHQCATVKCCTLGFFNTQAECKARDDYSPPDVFNIGSGCRRGICVLCNNGRWALIGCVTDPGGFGPCAERACIWPECVR